MTGEGPSDEERGRGVSCTAHGTVRVSNSQVSTERENPVYMYLHVYIHVHVYATIQHICTYVYTYCTAHIIMRT